MVNDIPTKVIVCPPVPPAIPNASLSEFANPETNFENGIVNRWLAVYASDLPN